MAGARNGWPKAAIWIRRDQAHAQRDAIPGHGTGLLAARIPAAGAAGAEIRERGDDRRAQSAGIQGEILAPPGLPETCQRGGHIPGARSVPWGKACNDDGTFKSATSCRKLYGAEGVVNPSR
jgi:thiosulfate/3-mercaptopyruvate sulfurtransferase